MKLRPQSVAGGLRHRVKFQKPIPTEDARGGPVVEWADHVTIWGEVMYLSGTEYWAARQDNSRAEGRVRIRYRDDINPTMRMVYDGRVLEILSLIPFGSRKTELHIMFKENLNAECQCGF